MKATKLREMSKEDLQQEETALREQVFKLRFSAATGQLEQASKLHNVRKDIARVRTILRELELGKKGRKS